MTTLSADHLAMSYLIDAHLAHLRALGQSPRTIELREYVLRRLHAWLPYGLAYAETHQLEAWRAAIAAARSAWTLATYDKEMRAFFLWADGRCLAGDPAAAIPPPRRPRLVPRPVTTEQLHTALERCGPWWRLVILLAALEGLRASEIAGLYRQDVTQECVYIRRAKGGDPAAVPTHPQIWQLVRDAPPGPLVHGPAGPVDGRTLTRWAGRRFRARGLPGVTLHRFRHWFATELLRQGCDLRTVQELMRHKSVTSTQPYTLITSKQREEGIGRLKI